MALISVIWLEVDGAIAIKVAHEKSNFRAPDCDQMVAFCDQNVRVCNWILHLVAPVNVSFLINVEGARRDMKDMKYWTEIDHKVEYKIYQVKCIY